MDTIFTKPSASTHLYLKEQAVDILKRIFNPLYEKGGFSPFGEVPVVGAIAIDAKNKTSAWSDELSAFLELSSKDAAPGYEFFLQLVEKADQQRVGQFFTEDFDEIRDERHLTCKVNTQTGRSKTVLGIKKMSDEASKKSDLLITFFDITALSEKSAHFQSEQTGNPDHKKSFDLSLTWLNHIFENKAAGIAILNEEGKFLKTNKTFQKLTGYDEPQLNKLTYLDLTPEADRSASTEKMIKLLSGSHDSINFEKRVITKSRELRWVELNITAIRHEKTYCLCFLTDIHEKKMAQENLRVREEQLEQAQQIAMIGSWGMDLRTGEITWSRGMYDILEIPYDHQPKIELASNSIHPEDIAIFTEKLLKNKEVVKNLEIRHLTESGIKHILINTRVDYENGIPVRYHGTSQDISERRFMDARLQQVQKTAKLCWWEGNLVTGEDVWSDSMYEMLELDKNTTKPCFESFLKTMPPEDEASVRSRTKDPEILKNGWHNLETRHKTKDGSYRHFLTSGNFIWDGDRPVRLIGTMMDISVAKQTQLRLEEAQNIARIGWWEANLITGESIWSDSMFELYELDKSTTTPGFDTYLKTVHPDDQEDIKSKMNDPEILKNGWYDEEMRHVMPDGTIKYFLVSGSSVMDGDQPVKLFGTNMDITAQKETRLKLEQAQQVAKLGWWEFDLTGLNNHWFSQEHLDILGVSGPEEVVTLDDFLLLVHPEDVPIVLDGYNNLDKNRGWANMIIRLKKKRGGYKYVTSNATAEFVNDQPVRLSGTIYDVTGFKEIETQLAKNVINLEAMVTSLDSMVLLIDDQLRYREVFCNDPTKLGVNPEDMIGEKVEKVLLTIYKADELLKTYSSINSVQELLQKALDGEALDPIEYKFSPDGNDYWWEIRFHSFKGQDGKKWIVFVINDITSRKNAEEELIKSMHKEKELSEMRAQFVSMASHQFRTPLTVIKSNMQLLELSKVKDPIVDKVRRRLQSEVDRLVNLMEDIMAMGKVQSNSVKPNFQPVSIRSLVKQVKLSVENQQNDGRSLTITSTGEERLIDLDIRFMEQALHNLIENAFKYSRNAPNPEVKLTYSTDKLRIAVIDQGIGIPKEDQANLFTTFHRGSNAQHIPGTGLGLAVTKEFIRLNHGTIFLNTRRKSGTEFYIDLPFND